MNWVPLTGFVGVITGGFITFFSTRHQQSKARQDRLDEQRVALYSEWITGLTRIVYGAKPDAPLDISRNKLMLVERSAALRALITKVRDSAPDPNTPEGEEHYYLLPQDPDPSWPPFDDAVVELIDAVRASLGK